jgi:hypothetical protein
MQDAFNAPSFIKVCRSVNSGSNPTGGLAGLVPIQLIAIVEIRSDSYI